MIHTVRSYVRQLQKNHHLTLAELSLLLGYKSQTSLVRLMQGTANLESHFKLAERLRTNSDIHLSEQESRQLDDILEMQDISDDPSLDAILLLRQVLRENSDIPEEPVMLTVLPGGAQMTFAERYGHTIRMRMTLINAQTAHIFQDLAQMLTNDNFHVEHYMYIDSDPLHTARAIQALLPVIYAGNYSAYAMNLDIHHAVPSGLLRADLMVCDYMTEDGVNRHEVISFSSPTTASVIENSHTLAQFMALLPEKTSFQAIRYSGSPAASGDYLAYSRFCFDLEKGRNVYRIKPDVGIDEIPVKILRRAVEEGPASQMMMQGGMLDICEEVFHQRSKQMLEKPECEYHVLKQKSMWQFVTTGRTSDHFWACRSYTLEERAAILEQLIERMDRCADYRLYFMKYDDELRDDEFVLYDGEALSIIKPETDYQLGGSHAETLISQPEFLDVFRTFFIKSIVNHHSLTQEQSRALLQEMLEWCRTELAKIE